MGPKWKYNLHVEFFLNEIVLSFLAFPRGKGGRVKSQQFPQWSVEILNTMGARDILDFLKFPQYFRKLSSIHRETETSKKLYWSPNEIRENSK